MIKKSAIEGSGISITEVIGVQLKMSDNSGYTIAGIYDDPDSLLPDCLTACTDSNTVCDRYIIRAASLKAVPEIVSQLQKAGFTVISHNDEIKDSLESAGTLSYVMMLFLVFSIVYVVIVFYSVIMNMLRDMYPFIAMIRAIGYRKKECLMLVFACSVYIFLFSAAMTAVMYFAGMPVIHRIFTAAEISDIYNISTDKLFQTFPYIPAAVLVVVLAGMLIADVMSAARIQKIQINKILHEVNI